MKILITTDLFTTSTNGVVTSVRNLYEELTGKGHDNKFIAQKAGIPEFTVRRNQGQARSFTKEQLREAVEDCVQMEEAVKTGRMIDVMSVEILIMSVFEE